MDKKQHKSGSPPGETGEGLMIFCQDDGVGVPQTVKEGMFKHDYHQISGLHDSLLQRSSE